MPKTVYRRQSDPYDLFDYREWSTRTMRSNRRFERLYRCEVCLRESGDIPVWPNGQWGIIGSEPFVAFAGVIGGPRRVCLRCWEVWNACFPNQTMNDRDKGRIHVLSQFMATQEAIYYCRDDEMYTRIMEEHYVR